MQPKYIFDCIVLTKDKLEQEMILAQIYAKITTEAYKAKNNSYVFSSQSDVVKMMKTQQLRSQIIHRLIGLGYRVGDFGLNRDLIVYF